MSVIIPVLNGEKYIAALLDSLNGQMFDKPFEVIVVDNSSDDNTVEIANSKGAKVIIQDRSCNISLLRNAGASMACGKLLAFVDVDCLPDQNWLECGRRRLESRDKIGVVGGQYRCPDFSTWVQVAWDSVRPTRTCNVSFVTSGNCFVKKNVFQEVKGFDESLETGEDYDFCVRVAKNYTILSDESVNVVHFGDPSTLLGRLRKEIWYGKNIKHILYQKPSYLPFWFSLAFLVCVVVLLFGITFREWRVVVFAAFGIICLPATMTIAKCWKVKKYKYFLQLVLINFIYLLGRMISLRFFFVFKDPTKKIH